MRAATPDSHTQPKVLWLLEQHRLRPLPLQEDQEELLVVEKVEVGGGSSEGGRRVGGSSKGR